MYLKRNIFTHKHIKHQEDIIINMYASNHTALKYMKQKLPLLKRKTDKIDAIVLHSYDSFTNKNGILRNLWETKN